MAKKAYIGVDGVARKIKKGYIGIDDKARKIKKAYIGVGGVARPCWPSGEVEYYGTLDNAPLSVARGGLAATTVGNYALFGGGATLDSVSSKVVDAYSNTLTRSTPTALTTAAVYLAATTIGSYALFGGGITNGANGTSRTATVNAYNASLTKEATVTSLSGSSKGLGRLAATSIGNYALFGGGYIDGSTNSANVDAYNASLTQSQPQEALQRGRAQMGATSNGAYAIFGSGTNEKSTDAYDASLTHIIASDVPSKQQDGGATSVGVYALFGGGGGNTNPTTAVNAFNRSLTLTYAPELTVARNGLAATTVGDFAIFGCGRPSGSSFSAVVDAYDSSLTRTNPTQMGNTFRNAATSVGSYALFAGGYASPKDTVYVYMA